jgi:hypothetical protein
MADSIGILRFFLSLGVGAIMVFVVGRITSPLFEQLSPHTQGNEAATGTVWLEAVINYFPFLILGVVFFGFIALSVWTRQGVLN